MSETQVNMICKTCRQVLSKHTGGDGAIRYEHGYQDLPNNHDAEPIPAPSDYLGRCDFCNGGIPAYVVPARDFKLPYSEREYSTGDWAACDVCASLVERNQWNRIERRVTEDHERRHGFPMDKRTRAALRTMYRTLRKNITGSVRPL